VAKLKLAYHSLNKLNKFIKVQKDPLSNLQKKNVVYKICCNDCDASYVGQTGRLLKQESPNTEIMHDGTLHPFL